MEFIKRRLVLSSLPLLLIFTFTAFSYLVNFTNVFRSLDSSVLGYLVSLRGVWLTRFFKIISDFGNAEVVISLTAAFFLVIWFYWERVLIAYALVALLFNEAIVYISKMFFIRERPELIYRLVSENDYSYVSGHSGTSVFLYGTFAYIYCRFFTKNGAKKFWVISAAFILVLLIGFSRLYLGVHYLSDVIGGYFVGAISLSILILISEFVFYKRHHKLK